jgi:hypothetical protein
MFVLGPILWPILLGVWWIGRFVGVYGPNSDSDRMLLWDELAGVLSLWEVPWCVRGDFNVTRFPSERLGSASLDSAMMKFSKFISNQGLMDLPLAGGCFTWSVTHDPPLWSRLDRFLVSPELEEWFPRILQKRLPRFCSDHFPILDTGEVSRGRRSFKFENMWLKADRFVALVKQWWDSYVFQGTPSYVLAHKLKGLKLDLKRWNEEVFGNIERNKRILIKDLQVFDRHEESRALNEEELLRKVEVVRELERCTLMEEVSWRQKARVMWIKEGDKCTRFF